MQNTTTSNVRTWTETERAYRAAEKLENRQLLKRFTGVLLILVIAVVVGSVLGSLAR